MTTDDDQSGKASRLRDRAEEILKLRPEAASQAEASVLELIHELEVHRAELEIQNEELRRAQGEISALHREFEDLYEFAPCGYVTLNAKGILTRCNLSGVTLLGAEKSRLKGEGFSRFVVPDRRDDFWSALKRSGQIGQKQSVELELQRADRGSLWVLADIQADRTEGGGVSQWRLALVDITERKRVEKSLRESEARFKAMLQAIPDLVLQIDRQGVILDCTTEDCDFGALSGPNLIGKCSRDLAPPEAADRLDVLIHTTLETGTLQVSEYQLPVPGRGARDYEVRMVASRVDEVTAIVRDVTTRKRLEKVLTNAKKQWEATFDAIADWVCIVNKDHRIIRSNKSADRFSGYPVREIIGKRCYEIVHGTNGPIPDCPVIKAFESRQREEVEFQNSDGRWLQVSVDPLECGDNAGGLFVHVVKDITQRKQLESEKAKLEAHSRQIQKAESLGRMAGAVAHHFNNMLGAVMGNLEIALIDLPEEMGTRSNIVQAMKASLRAAEISGLMLAYLGQRVGKKSLLDLARVVKETVPLLSALTPQKVLLNMQLQPRGPYILGDSVHIKQIMTNLVSNAVEAMEDREEGCVFVTTQVVTAPELQGLRFFPLDWKPNLDEYACLSVADTGIGMDETTREKIFDPFFSTKFVGRGLGLAVVLGLVRSLDGGISVESKLGEGAVFRVFVPTHPLEVVTPETGDPVVAGPSEKGSLVLLVEDEPIVRDMGERMLKRLGYEVVTGSDGHEAVEIFRERKEDIRVVVLDLSMPKVNGWETLTALRALRPDIPVVLASGHDEAQVLRTEHVDRPQAFLQKPYQFAELKAALEAANRVPSVGDRTSRQERRRDSGQKAKPEARA
jgi:PAS domain S-box-containing protein